MAIKRKRTGGKVTFSIQLPLEQEENICAIAEFENIDSKAEVLRRAFDYYVKAEYPQLAPKVSA